MLHKRLQVVVDTKTGLKGKDLQLAVDIVKLVHECVKHYSWKPMPGSKLGELVELLNEAKE